MTPFQIFNHQLHLHPSGAVFDPASATLVVADLHLGKAASFRSHGIPIPEGDFARDLGRLAALVAESRAKRLVVAGDLFHSPSGLTPEIEADFAAFLDALGIPLDLVIGNHDAKLAHLPDGLGAIPMLDLGPLRIIHDPKDATAPRLHLAGHWHPVVRIKDGKRTSLRLPCFLFRENTLVLPSFGSFTGGAVFRPAQNDRVFVPLRDRVVEIPDFG